MRKGLILSYVLLSIFLIGFVDAQVKCSDPSQTILKLSSSGNAHGEVFGQNNYLFDICYNDIFVSDFDVPAWGQDHRDCSLLNNGGVLNLSGTTNAHAELLDGGNYGTGVCYGDLECVSVPIGSACDSANGFTEVVSISGDTNAHLQMAGKVDGFTTGNIICCKSPSADPGTGKMGAVYWTDFANRRIARAGVNSTVNLVAETTFLPGNEVTFDIYEDDGLLGNEKILMDGKATVVDGKAVYTWKIDDYSMEICLNDLWGLGEQDDECEFWFKARVGSEFNDSDWLLVNNSQINGPPIANITSPIHRQIYFSGVDVDFTQDSFDENDNIVSYLWTIYEDNVVIEERTEKNFVYQFPKAAQYTVTLRVEDELGFADEYEVSVVAINSPGMLAYINEPFHHAIFSNIKLEVRFNASDSYVIDTEWDGVYGNDNCGYTITCDAGYCPIETMNVPDECTSGDTEVDLTGELNHGFDDSNLEFSWVFRDEWGSQPRNGVDDVTGLAKFGLPSSRLNDKHIDLNLEFGDAVINKNTHREFTLLDDRQCIDNGNVWLDIDDNGYLINKYDTTGNNDACKGANGVVGDKDDCCPDKQECTADGCILLSEPDETCDYYEDIVSCKDDIHDYRKNEPLWEEWNCGGVDEKGRRIVCACDWQVDEAVCGLEKLPSPPGTKKDDSCYDYQCLYTYTEGECLNGRMALNVTTYFDSGTCGGAEYGRKECEDESGSYIVPCGRPTIKLPFFGKAQFMFVLLIIGLIYFISVKLENKKK